LRQFHRTFIILLIACIGLGIFGSGTVHATGGFDVPKVNDQFNQFEQSPPPKQNLPAPPPVEKEKGLWDTVSQPFKSAWEWTTDTISGAWEWTTEKASALWDWFVGVLSKITEVVVDALAAAWDWIKANYKKIIVLLLIIVLAVFAVWLITTAAALIAAGSSLTILSFTISPQILSFVGYGILLGGGFGGLTSWLSGNEFMSMEMLTDTLFGCIAGGIGGLFGELIGGARFITWLGSKIPWLPTAVKGSVGTGVEQSVFDFFKTGKINVKNTLIAIGIGGLLSYGGWLFTNNLDTIVTSINKISFPTVKMHVLASADSNLRIPSLEIGHTKIEDTQFGAWLQKFASTKSDNVTGKSNISPKHDEIAHGGYYKRKEFRSMINNAKYTPHGYKHLKAKTPDEAIKFSQKGAAQYLPSINNKVLEKEALLKGYVIDTGNDNYYFIYNANKTVGYDRGMPTTWIRAELSGGEYHGHPIAGDRLEKYLKRLGIKNE
jgi:hypothetical protein